MRPNRFCNQPSGLPTPAPHGRAKRSSSPASTGRYAAFWVILRGIRRNRRKGLCSPTPAPDGSQAGHPACRPSRLRTRFPVQQERVQVSLAHDTVTVEVGRTIGHGSPRRDGDTKREAHRRGAALGVIRFVRATKGPTPRSHPNCVKCAQRRSTDPRLRARKRRFAVHGPPCDGFINPRSAVRVRLSP